MTPCALTRVHEIYAYSREDDGSILVQTDVGVFEARRVRGHWTLVRWSSSEQPHQRSNQSMKPRTPIALQVQRVCHATLPWLISFSLDVVILSARFSQAWEVITKPLADDTLPIITGS